MLSVDVSTSGSWTLLRVCGEVDMATGPQLRQELVNQIRLGNDHLIVDLEGVDFIDSTGLGVLIGGLKRARGQGGDLKVSGLGSRLQRIFDLTGLGDVLAAIDLGSSSAAEAPVRP